MGNQQIQAIKNQDIKPKGCCTKVSLYLQDKNIDPSDITCVICFQIYKSPRMMKCKHTFCEPCIQDWGKCQTTSCPYCRTELKRVKSNFGKIDRKTQIKIQKALLKCRGCDWTGNAYQYFSEFQINPTIDDDELPCEKIHEEDPQHECQKLFIYDSEIKKQEYYHQQQKQEALPTKQSLDDILSPDHKKVMNLIRSQSIFINQDLEEPIFFDMEQQMKESRQKTWEDFLFDDDDLMC